MVDPSIFREYDIRGVVDLQLNYEIVYLIGRAIGTMARRKGVGKMTVGRDCRLTSEEFAEALIEGLKGTGIKIINIGLCTTPMLYFSIRQFNAEGGVMVTGSHNPPEFNGFKVCIGPDTIYGEDIQFLYHLIRSGEFERGIGEVESSSVFDAYGDFILKSVYIEPGINVVLDGGNGTGGYFALPLFESFGCKVTPLYCEPDGRFPHHFPDPTIPEYLEDLIKEVKRQRADVGIAYDGDADRLGVITDMAKILWGDELLLLFARYILKDNPGAAIIGEVKCSQKLYDEIAKNGGRPIMWKAGHSLIKQKMKEEKALLAGEMSGHLFFADRYFGYDDAVYASFRLLEIISRTGKNLSELMADIPVTYATPEIRIDCPDSIKFRVVDEVKSRLEKKFSIVDIDGVRVQFIDGWGLIRASNTQPVLVLRFEATTEERLRDIRRSIEYTLNEVMNAFIHD
ncbi:MAG: phosphomannomutase/phosphoglucomutase [Syntrophales bacterium]|nr:phosphomannomutase/phosphoglucomutase [Syntrophales bacterium]